MVQTIPMILTKMSSYMSERKNNIDALTEAGASSKKYSKIEDLVKAGGINKYTELGQETNLTEMFILRNSNQLNNIYSIDSQLEIMHDDITTAISEMTIYQGNINHPYTNTLKNLIKGHLKVMEDALNHSVAGSYLFSGYNTNQPAVKDIVNTSNLLEGVATANYAYNFEGSSEVISESIAVNKFAKVNVVASDKVFVDIIGTYHKILEKLEKGDEILTESNELSEQQEGLRQLRGKLAGNAKVIEDTNVALKNNKEKIDNMFGELVYLDVTEIAEKFASLSQEEEHLKMIFSIISKLQGFSIIDYLK